MKGIFFYSNVVRFSLFLFLLAIDFCDGFPESQNPFSVGPFNHVPTKAKECRVSLFQNVSLNEYSKVIRFPYSIGPCANFQWNQVILRVEGSVAGVQYDRAGALWLGGVEILRMTTPEPTANGIAWQVERDLTVYGSIFRAESSEIQIQIPNNVNKVYTGVIYLSSQVTFYMVSDAETETFSPIPQASLVLSLSNPPQNQDAWASMAVRGNQSKAFRFCAPPGTAANRAHIDLYASAHGCEEFWYTNPPDFMSQQLGLCGGGSTRAIQILIDGKVAGIQPPFPVIYTGGINPLLWRPQTGIYSFNIPPYFFDISPYVDNITDGQSHTLEVTVLGNNEKGEWNVDPVLVLFQDDKDESSQLVATTNPESVQYLQRGPILSIFNSPIQLRDKNSTTNITWTEEFEAELIVEGMVGKMPVKLSSKMSSFVINSLVRDSIQVTSVSMKTTMTSSTYNRVQQMEFPLQVETNYQDLNHSFLIMAQVDQRLRHSMAPYASTCSSCQRKSFSYTDKILANATYSRSTDPNRTILIAMGESHQETNLQVDDQVCLEQQIDSNDGYVYHAKGVNHNNCQPVSFCSLLDLCFPKLRNLTTQDIPASRLENDFYANSDTKDLLFRHPHSLVSKAWRNTRSSTTSKEKYTALPSKTKLRAIRDIIKYSIK